MACRDVARSPTAILPFSRMVPRRHGHRETRRGRSVPPGAGESFRTAKNGPGHTGTRSWYGRHRHVSPGMPVFAMMALVRSRAKAMPPPKKTSGRLWIPPGLVAGTGSTRLARRRTRPAHVIAWSTWRRAHQAAAWESHPNSYCNCSANLVPESQTVSGFTPTGLSTRPLMRVRRGFPEDSVPRARRPHRPGEPARCGHRISPHSLVRASAQSPYRARRGSQPRHRQP